MMFPILYGLLQAATPQTAPAPPKTPVIVVTANSSKTTAAALAACLARQCPPKEDIDASLAHAENQFVEGDYQAARSTLLASRNRNRRYARTLPIEVADLSRANARLASLNGMADEARISTIDTLDVLKEGLPATDARLLMQRLEVGDIFVQQGRITFARQLYDEVAKQARKAGLATVEGYAMFRSAGLLTALASRNAEFQPAAKAATDRIARTTDPALEPFRQAVLLMKARIDGSPGAIENVIAQVRGKLGTAPRLIYSPPIDYQPAGRTQATTVQAMGDANPQWVDISFWVAPDGTVKDIELVRQSRNFEDSWMKPVTKALAGRRYSPFLRSSGDPGVLRLERYSLVSDRVAFTGTRFLGPSPSRRIELLDLTMPEPQSGAAQPTG